MEHISVSQVRMWNHCQLQWYLKYIEKLKSRCSVRVALGIGVHSGIAQANMLRQAGVDMDIDLVLEAANNVLTENFSQSEYIFDDLRNERDTELRAERILRASVPKLDSVTGQPMLIEHQIGDDVIFDNGVKLVGYVDLMDINGAISDFKIGARAKSQADVDTDLQLALYAYALNRDADAVNTQLVSVDSKNGEVHSVGTWKTKQDMLNAYNILNTTTQQIEQCCKSGSFIPNVEGNW